MSAGVHLFLEFPGENLFPCCFLLAEAACIPQLMASFLHLQRQQRPNLHYISLTLLLHPSSTSKGPCDYIGLTAIIQDNLTKVNWPATLIPSAILIPFCHGNNTSQIPGIRKGGWHYFACHIHHINRLKKKNHVIMSIDAKYLTKSNVHSW